MRYDPLDRSAQSFSDLIMNLLAILIVITLLAILLLKSAVTPLVYAVDEPAERNRAFALAQLSGIPKFSTYFYVNATGVFELHFEALATAISAANYSPQGRIPLLGEDKPLVDYRINTSLEADEFRPLLQDPAQYMIRLTFPAMPNNSVAMNQDNVLALIEARAYRVGRTPNFIVAADGFDTFAMLEKALFDQHRCFRWSYTKGGQINIERSSRFFRKFVARRCTR